MAGTTDLKEFLFGILPSFSWEEWMEWFADWGISRAAVVSVLFLGLFSAAVYVVPDFLPLVTGWILGTLPLWGPPAAVLGFSKTWMWYVQSLYIFERENPVLLEVKMPREITKSPRAMEQVLTNLWIRSGETTFIDRAWGGGSRPWFSFEMASFGGDVHFYVWTRRNHKNIIESNMYAQYPEVELHEVEDYASKFNFDPSVHECFVSDYRLTGTGKSETDYFGTSAYPIRTYVEFELDKDPKDEHKVDPFAQVVETMSSLKPTEQAWLQLIIRSHLGKDYKNAVEKEVEKLRVQGAILAKHTLEEHADELMEGRPPHPRPTWRMTELVRTMERNMGKLPFEVGARSIYIAPAGKMHSPTFTAVRWIYRPFGNPHFSTLYRPRRGHNPYDYPWQDFRGWRWTLTTRRYIDAYRRRSWFLSPWVTPYNLMSVEAIATLWHPPSTVVRSPGLQRLPSAKAEPPPNLPR